MIRQVNLLTYINPSCGNANAYVVILSTRQYSGLPARTSCNACKQSVTDILITRKRIIYELVNKYYYNLDLTALMQLLDGEGIGPGTQRAPRRR